MQHAVALRTVHGLVDSGEVKERAGGRGARGLDQQDGVSTRHLSCACVCGVCGRGVSVSVGRLLLLRCCCACAARRASCASDSY
jgi:hypothetical protein